MAILGMELLGCVSTADAVGAIIIGFSGTLQFGTQVQGITFTGQLMMALASTFLAMDGFGVSAGAAVTRVVPGQRTGTFLAGIVTLHAGCEKLEVVTGGTIVSSAVN